MVLFDYLGVNSTRLNVWNPFPIAVCGFSEIWRFKLEMVDKLFGELISVKYSIVRRAWKIAEILIVDFYEKSARSGFDIF